MTSDKTKQNAASLSIISNSLLIIFKLCAGVLSGSISIISEAIHSASDLLASILTFFAVKQSSQPADKEHPFGHGHYEDIAALIEGILIIIASIFIIVESYKKIMTTDTLYFNSTLGIIVMAIAVFTNFAVSRYLSYVAQKTDSIALRADAEHLNTDIYSSLGVLIGLILIKKTGLVLLDPIIAIFVALVILKTGFSIIKETMGNLLDCTLPIEDLNKIEDILKNCNDIKSYKNVRTRKLGSSRDIDITLLCDENLSLKKCHEICDNIEEKIKNDFSDIQITIHCEPFE